MAKSPVDQIIRMLDDDAPERRLAAVIVLGELKPKAAVAALGRVLGSSHPARVRHALEALLRIGVAKRTLEPVWALLEHREPEVRVAAAALIASAGEAVVPEVRQRLSDAHGDLRRGLESILSQLGGHAAFDALLEALEEGDDESNRVTALELRSHLKDADATVRRGYRSRLTKFVERLRDTPGASVGALAAGVKVLGFLEDPKTSDTLLALARDPKLPPDVRKEALIGLRFTLKSGAPLAAVEALVGAASSTDGALAQTALMTLATLELPASVAPAMAALALHRDLDRARVAIDKLGSIQGGQATETLVDILARGDKRRAELAAAALEPRPEADEALASLLAETSEPERAKLVARALEPRAERLGAAQVRAILDGAIERLAEHGDAVLPALGLAEKRDPARVGARLREEAERLKKKRKPDAEARVLTLLVARGHATDTDRYRLASIQLAASKLDPRARRADPALAQLAALSRRGFDVQKALRADRAVGLEQLYYVGFCFLEDDVDGGEELLREVVAKGGRKKIATAAKNKLKLAASA